MTLLAEGEIVRASDFRAAGISPATLSRLSASGRILRVSRGLYQRADAPVDANQTLAEAARRVRNGVVCLTSALAFHGLTDALPAKVWMAIDRKSRKPKLDYPPLQIVRFSPWDLAHGVTAHRVANVPVKITDPAKTVIDLFRYRRPTATRYRASPGLNLALEGLREGLRQRKFSVADVAREATMAGIWKVVEPYLAGMTSHV